MLSRNVVCGIKAVLKSTSSINNGAKIPPSLNFLPWRTAVREKTSTAPMVKTPESRTTFETQGPGNFTLGLYLNVAAQELYWKLFTHRCHHLNPYNRVTAPPEVGRFVPICWRIHSKHQSFCEDMLSKYATRRSCFPVHTHLALLPWSKIYKSPENL